jgi:hypothetical protein
MWVSQEDGPAGGDAPRSPAHRTWRFTVDTRESSASHAHPSAEDLDDTVEAHYSCLERLRPHACTDGLVFLTYTVFEEAVGEEVERLEVVPCRRCAERT